MSHKEIEEGTELNLDFTKLKKVVQCGEDIIPAVAQDHQTGEVLIVGYVSAFALETAQRRGWRLFGAPVETNSGLRERHLEISLKSWRYE